jgi:hypothetical protein
VIESEFSRMLQADPVLAARCERIAAELRAAAAKEIAAAESSDRITQRDLDTYVN